MSAFMRGSLKKVFHLPRLSKGYTLEHSSLLYADEVVVVWWGKATKKLYKIPSSLVLERKQPAAYASCQIWPVTRRSGNPTELIDGTLFGFGLGESCARNSG